MASAAVPSAAKLSAAVPDRPAGQTPEMLAAVVQEFLAEHPEAVAFEEGRAVFALNEAQYAVRSEHGRCVLQIWSGERNLVRTVVGATERQGTLRLQTKRFGHANGQRLDLVSAVQRRTPRTREPARKAYLEVLERVLQREFPDWVPEAFRTAMDLERSFGPAYARGVQVRGREAWAVIGVGAAESQAVIDGVLTLGVLWLHHCRERAEGRRLFRGLRLVLPWDASMLTLARLAWMNQAAAQWELYELDERTEELAERDAADQGNVRTRLVHAPDLSAARERFASAIVQVMALVPAGEHHRVEHRLRSPTELAFLLHGMEFARARLRVVPGTFRYALESTVGVGTAETVLAEGTRKSLALLVADLFRRRNAQARVAGRDPYATGPGRSIGVSTGRAAHERLRRFEGAPNRLEVRERAVAAGRDPLYRAAPERWLESVLRENLAPLTRSLASCVPSLTEDQRWGALGEGAHFANDFDPDTRGNRADLNEDWSGRSRESRDDRLIPRFNPAYVYTQVPAIAGASDRGMLDLLGVTEDGRLAVIELKAADDLQLALQGLDYWIRVRHHHAQTHDADTGFPTGMGELQRHGYFRGLELSPLPPRLYLVAPALHVHPATEVVLRYVSPEVPWTLLALDERWRQEVRVVWRKKGGAAR